MPASHSRPKSAPSTDTTSAALAFCRSRAYSLIPLVTIPPSSEEEGTTRPPGHMQKVYTPRSPLRWESWYSPTGKAGWPARSPYSPWSITDWSCSARTPTEKALGISVTPF